MALEEIKPEFRAQIIARCQDENPVGDGVQCPHCGAFAFPTDDAISASQSNASITTVWFQCAGAGCRRPSGARVDS